MPMPFAKLARQIFLRRSYKGRRSSDYKGLI